MTRFNFFPSSPRAILGTSNGDDEVYLFPLEPARDPWHTARLSLPATCDCRTLMTCYLPRWAPVNGLA